MSRYFRSRNVTDIRIGETELWTEKFGTKNTNASTHDGHKGNTTPKGNVGISRAAKAHAEYDVDVLLDADLYATSIFTPTHASNARFDPNVSSTCCD